MEDLLNKEKKTMDDSQDGKTTQEEKEKASQKPRTGNQARGLYRYVNVSVRTLNLVIIVGIALIVILIVYGVANNGYTITFDSNGGTDVESQDLMYGDLVEEPEAPSREGYAFTGWYTDESCTTLWDFETDAVSADMELYAGWAAE